MASSSSRLGNSVGLDSYSSDGESEFDDESAPDSGSEHDIDCDSPVYMYQESPTRGRFGFHRCRSVSDKAIVSVGHTESDFQYPFHMSEPVLMPGVKIRPKRGCAVRLSTPFRDYPASSIKEDDIKALRMTYSLPDSLSLRAPLDTERAHNSRSDEIVVYEAYFDIGFRGIMPPIIANVARFFNISPGQLIPTAWRVLIALQVLGEFNNVDVRVEEVLFSYFFKAHNVDASRCTISKRTTSFPPLVYDYDRGAVRNLPYEKKWQSRFLFMKVGFNPNFPVDWFFRDFSHPRCEEGEERALKLIVRPKPERLVSFLVSCFALEKSSLWGYRMSAFDVSTGGGALAAFRAAYEDDMEDDLTIVTTEIPPSSNALPKQVAAPTDNLRPSRASKRKTSTGDLFSNVDHSDVLADLNKKAFPRDVESFGKLGHAAVLDESQVYLLKVMSACHSSKVELAAVSKDNKRLNNILTKAKADLVSGKERYDTDMAKKDGEILSLKTDHDQQIAALKSAENKLRLDLRRSEKNALKAASAGAIKRQWAMVRDLKMGQAHTWDVRAAEEAYREVLTAEAKAEGKVPPVFSATFTDFENEAPTGGILGGDTYGGLPLGGDQ
ncbi:unnamed protein product [Microthlaspi erraticum]|uniref:Transposase (Putative), gypsy type n=1 Tax=Microthlaspi erraticum TaxID=1685480 RepID=A0A6D2III4_9BRAS|nr:unnamed protein product [Microthlaspi erraticum]CAA7022676.1 unnamed protein product [Microthlaspi erraticum]CAA7022678.1 unnamed protein product [Microthlaspi erraticum]CAA7024287.1 unnamed protein product [Microthlaspi erraticum]CAA7027870.1 unnamed protein product [Microthlaspi erraticum]